MARGSTSISGFRGSTSDQNEDQEKDRIVILVDRATMQAEFEDEEYAIKNEQFIYCVLYNILSWMQASRSVEATRKYFEEIWKEEPGIGSDLQ